MNKREKILMVATGFIVLLGGIFMLSGGDDPPQAEAAAPESTTTTVPAEQASDAEASPVAVQFGADALTELLESAAPVALEIGDRDPFLQEGVDIVPAVASTTSRQGGKDIPAVDLRGIYLEENRRGALINGQVYFEGDDLDANTRLVRVTSGGVVLSVRGQEKELNFDPVNRRSPSGQTSD